MFKALLNYLNVFNNNPKSSMKPDKIIVGLGNPGAKYRNTRHNVGYMVLAELAARHAVGKPRSQFQADVLDAQIAGQNVMLLCPTTFMNRSGSAVAEVVRFYKLPLENICVVCDDIDRPLAKLRMRANGSCGGQNGLRDIIAKLGSQDFPRFRIGVDRPQSKEDVSAYILQSFRPEEKEEINFAIQEAADAMELWVKNGPNAVMDRYNRSDKSK
ncbi:MAG: aminoacyl-tRNA hydrolase [Planctomycetia bacterium]|nr:aminoacyl-tRNA hydrolase [Planctomycetia bacterium]